MEQLNNNSRRSFLKASLMLGLRAALSQGMIGQAFANPQPIAKQASQGRALRGLGTAGVLL